MAKASKTQELSQHQGDSKRGKNQTILSCRTAPAVKKILPPRSCLKAQLQYSSPPLFFSDPAEDEHYARNNYFLAEPAPQTTKAVEIAQNHQNLSTHPCRTARVD
ncbi:hypothetical protein Pyn_33246 [Prunus yedoensis var. nudiflora]|uniref:Uncharacterized protein n=1 Tax=Prunus yedoensis var. nudiflora TaxID=2094558 RepID=A0A314ZI47_PRUYE|nr:hypothetical protein Pyn_33246 [Prunus yedoensis var. nudiflora]